MKPPYRTWLIASLIIGLLSGACGGAKLTLTIASAGGITAIAHADRFLTEVNANVHALIVGWMGLFLIGCAQRVLPEFWRVPLRFPEAGRAIFPLLLVGVVLHSGGESLARLWHPGAIAMLGGSAAEIVAVAIFSAQVFATARSVSVPGRTRLALVGTVFFLVTTIFDSWYTWQTIAAGGDLAALIKVVSTWQPVLRDLQVHGIGFFLLFSLALAAFPIPEEKVHRVTRLALFLLLPAVILEIAFFLLYKLSGNHALAALQLVPWLFFLVGTLLFTARWWRTTDAGGARLFLRCACLWLIVSLVMLLLLRPYTMLLGFFSHAYFAAAIQAMATGFIVQLVLALIVRTSDSGGCNRVPCALLNLGLVLHIVAMIGLDWNRGWSQVLASAGLIEGFALAWWIVLLLKGLQGHASSCPR